MCILVFDLVMNFKAKDFIFIPLLFFLKFQRGGMEITLNFFSPPASRKLPVDLRLNELSVCMCYV